MEGQVTSQCFGSQRSFYSQHIIPHTSVFLEGPKKVIQEGIFQLKKCKAQMWFGSKCSESRLLGPVIGWDFRTAALPLSTGHRDGFQGRALIPAVPRVA